MRTSAHSFHLKVENPFGEPDGIRISLLASAPVHLSQLPNCRHDVAAGIVNLLQAFLGVGNS